MGAIFHLPFSHSSVSLGADATAEGGGLFAVGEQMVNLWFNFFLKKAIKSITISSSNKSQTL